MEQNSAKADIIMEVLQTYFPVECEMAGTSNLVNIAHGISKEIRSTGGSNFDISEPISLLVAGVGFLNSVITVYSILKKERQPVPPASELKMMVDVYINNNTDVKNTAINNTTNNLTNDMKVGLCRQTMDQIAATPSANFADRG